MVTRQGTVSLVCALGPLVLAATLVAGCEGDSSGSAGTGGQAGSGGTGGAGAQGESAGSGGTSGGTGGATGGSGASAGSGGTGGVVDPGPMVDTTDPQLFELDFTAADADPNATTK